MSSFLDLLKKNKETVVESRISKGSILGQVVSKQNAIEKELEEKIKEEEQVIYGANLLNPELNRFKTSIADSVSSYLIWLRAQNNLAFNMFTIEQMANFYVKNISKPDMVIFALEHAPENTLATIYESIAKGMENQSEFLSMKAKHTIIPKRKTNKGESIDYAPYEVRRAVAKPPTQKQKDILLKDYGKMSLEMPVVMKMSFSDAQDMIGALFSKNVLWTYDEKVKQEERAKSLRKGYKND